MKSKFILIGLLVAISAFAQSKANFSGTWKMDVAKSEFGMMPPPEIRTDTIKHDEPGVKISVDSDGPQGKEQYDVQFSTDNKETVNKMGDNEAKVTAAWDAAILVVATKLNLKQMDMDIDIKSKWSLSEDGKTLTQDAHVTTPQGEMDMKFVYAKQEEK